MKILITGFPGAGKSYLAKKLQKEFTAAWFDADKIRAMYGDWDFSLEGRQRSASRMKQMCEVDSDTIISIADFICPTNDLRELFDADYTIWVNTVKESKFDDTNKLFEIPTTYNWEIKTCCDDDLENILKILKII